MIYIEFTRGQLEDDHTKVFLRTKTPEAWHDFIKSLHRNKILWIFLMELTNEIKNRECEGEKNVR